MADEHVRTIKILSSLSLLLGIWLMISVVALRPAAEVGWNGFLVGLLTSAGAVIRFTARHTSAVSWAMTLLAAWLIMSPWVIGGATGDVRTWNYVIVGVLLAGIQALSLTLSGVREPSSRAT